jgi:hypothetical protein
MEQVGLLEGFEFWKVLVCFLGSTVGAFYFYYKSSDYSKLQQWGLVALRFVAIFTLFFLLLGPKRRMVTNEYSSPIIVLVIDDSESIKDNDGQIKVVQRVNQDFEKYSLLGYDVHLRGLYTAYEHTDSIKFLGRKTDLNKTLKSLEELYYGLDLSKIILYSDGIENSGTSVLSSQYHFKLDVVGVGDTTERMDVKVLRIERNENVYKGNAFIARAIIEAIGVPKLKRIQVSFYRNDKKIGDTVVFAHQKKLVVNFIDTPKKEGVFGYEIVVETLEGEASVVNNTKKFFIEVLEGRKKVLLLYNSPHPDVKALRDIFNNRKNFILDVVSLKEEKNIIIKNYQLVVFHGLPTFTNQVNKLIAETKLAHIPSVYFVTNQTYLPLFNVSSNVFTILSKGEKNHVGAFVNDEFDYFDVSYNVSDLINNLSPLEVPYGQYGIKTGTVLLLGQKVGKLKTDFPILMIKYGNNKEGVFVGEGFWKWRMETLVNGNDVQLFDDYFFKYFQLLANNRSFDRLKVYPVKSKFTTTESVIFQGVTYNKLYENVYGEKIKLSIKNEKGERQQYTFISSQSKGGFVLPFQPKGIYTYASEVLLNDEKFTTHGKYVVDDVSLEQLNLQVNFDKLRSLVVRQKGAFRKIDESFEPNQTATKVIHSSTEDKELIEYKWLFFVLCFVLSLEWFLRKYFGVL